MRQLFLLAAFVLASTEAFVVMIRPEISTRMAAKKTDAIVKGVSQAAVSAALAGAILTAPTNALAARSGGRAGGSSFRSRPTYSRPAPRTTVRTYAAPVAIPVPVSPFGYGGFGYGGINTGAYLGLSLIDTILDEQRRLEYTRQQIEVIRKFLAMTKRLCFADSKTAWQGRRRNQRS